MKSSFLLAALAGLASAQLPTCHEAGSCLGANYIFDFDAEDQNACLEICQADLDCVWWQQDDAIKECQTYSSACEGVSLVPECPDCISGQKTCDKVYECDLRGQCEGTFKGTTDEYLTQDECLQACKDKPEGDCLWYSWLEEGSECWFWETCPTRNTLVEYVTGQVECGLQDFSQDFHKLFLSNGFDSIGSQKDEVIDVKGTSPTRSCPAPALFPVSRLFEPAGGFVADRAVICGGLENGDENQASDDCYQFLFDDPDDGTTDDTDGGVGQWTLLDNTRLTRARGRAKAVQLDETSFWITGGMDRKDSYLSTSEIFVNIGETPYVIEGPALTPRPNGVVDHCIIQISPSEFVLLGGFPYDTGVHLYNNEGEGNWTDLADMPGPKRGPYCGMVTRTDGRRDIVVAAGVFGAYSPDTWVYSIDDNTWSETPGTSHPFSDSAYGISVPYQDTFLTTQGDGAYTTIVQDIYKYNAGSDRWDKLGGQGKVEANHFGGLGFLVPDSFYLCSGD